MPQTALDNLVRAGQFKAEPPAQAEFDGLVRSGNRRLADAQTKGLHIESAFDLAYNAAHALALAALIRVAGEVAKRVAALGQVRG